MGDVAATVLALPSRVRSISGLIPLVGQEEADPPFTLILVEFFKVKADALGPEQLGSAPGRRARAQISQNFEPPPPPESLRCATETRIRAMPAPREACKLFENLNTPKPTLSSVPSRISSILLPFLR